MSVRKAPAWTAPLHLLTLTGFAVAQPIYDLLGRNAAFFVFRRFQPGDFFLFVLLLSLLLPAGLVAVAELVGLLGEPARRRCYDLWVGLLAAVLVLPWIVRAGDPPAWLALPTALLVGGGFAVARRRWLRLHQFLSLLAPAVLVFSAVFLCRAGVRAQWLEARVAQPSATEAGSGQPIAMLVFDALPTTSLMDDRGGIDEVRYPNFARLAREGTWFRQATTVDAYTIVSLPAMLTGRCPLAEGTAPVLTNYPQNLFTYLGGSYRLDVAETVTRLCPATLCEDRELPPFRQRMRPAVADASIVFLRATLPSDWADHLPTVDRGWGDFGRNVTEMTWPRERSDQVERFRRQLDRFTAAPTPTLLFTHLLLPHPPYGYLPTGRRYRTTRGEPGGSWKIGDPWVAAHAYQKHLLQLGYADSVLGELLDRLEEMGLYDETLVVVTADHGNSFRPGRAARTLSEESGIDIAPVPLLIKRPAQRAGGLRDDSVQTVDILPMMAEALGVPAPPWVDGRPLGGVERSGEASLSCHGTTSDWTPPPLLDRLLLAADRKVELFGTGSAVGGFPRVGPHVELIGESGEAACAEGLELEVELNDPERYTRVNPRSGYVPAEISGVVKGPIPEEGLDLAVAVNGTVRATTRTYLWGDADSRPWSAVVPESAFRRGDNDVRVFAVEAGPGCRLRPLRGSSAPLSLLDTRLGMWEVPRVVVTGFRAPSLLGDRRVRWTKGTATVEVPLSRSDARRLRRVRVDLAAVGELGTRLRVRIDGEELFHQRVEPGPWSGTFRVGRRRQAGPVTITLESDTFEGAGRIRGVAVEGIWLLPRRKKAAHPGRGSEGPE